MASVFSRTGATAAARAAVADPSTLEVQANLVGQTAHFAVYADPALGADGARDAAVVLADCEADYLTVSGYFGGMAAGPFAVILFSNPNGAYHMTCAATELFCDATTAPANGEMSEFLNVAEFVEVFEAMQGKGWDCGKANGEGLSRVLATEAHPTQLDGFATAAVWLDSNRANHIDKNFNSDTNEEANGCSVLFLNWLRYQLKFSWAQIVGATAPTLGQTYAQLAGKKDGFTQFSALLAAHFPKGRPSGLAGDNPFPL